VDEVQRMLGKEKYDSLTHVAILEGAKLVGVLKIEDLFSVPNETLAGQAMNPDPLVVGPDTDQEVAARRAVEYGESALPVVD
jgi:magnesium transporter